MKTLLSDRRVVKTFKLGLLLVVLLNLSGHTFFHVFDTVSRQASEVLQSDSGPHSALAASERCPVCQDSQNHYTEAVAVSTPVPEEVVLAGTCLERLETSAASLSLRSSRAPPLV